MRAVTAAVPLLALVLAGCGPKQLALPEDPIDRAATCGVVAAAKARKDLNSIAASLPFDRQLGVIHYTLLAGVDGDSFSREKASAASKRMPELADAVTKGKWETLVPACAAAFPATAPKEPPKLAPTRGDQQLECYMLADFLRTALQSSEASYSDQMTTLGDLRRTLDGKLGARFAAKGKDDADAQKDPRDKALGAIARRGPPAEMLKLCVAEFPTPKPVL